MELGIKERQRYRDVSWLMPSVDIESIMNILGTKIHGWSGDRVIGFCPDHVHYVGRKPSDPNWLLNTKTGETFCLTEGRGSNLVWTLCRVLGCHPVDAVKIITGVDAESLTQMKISANVIRGKMRGMRELPEQEEPPKPVAGLDDISKDLISRPTSPRMYDFFMNPPGKRPTNILKSTVDRYGVFERTWGYYADRAIIPFFLKGELKGFAAIDLLGKEAWMAKHSLNDKYKKTLMALNFKAGEYLFGFDDCQKGCDFLIVVEGPREVMKLWQEGFTNVVATSGIHVGPKQLVMLASLAPKRVLLMYDNDPKGVDAMEKMEKALSRLFVVRKCFVPEGMDPKNLSGEELKKVVEAGCKD